MNEKIKNKRKRKRKITKKSKSCWHLSLLWMNELEGGNSIEIMLETAEGKGFSHNLIVNNSLPVLMIFSYCQNKLLVLITFNSVL